MAPQEASRAVTQDHRDLDSVHWQVLKLSASSLQASQPLGPTPRFFFRHNKKVLELSKPEKNMAHITDLPMELLLEIFSYLPWSRDLRALRSCCRCLNWWVSSHLFACMFKERSRSRRPELVFMAFVIHAVKHDSQNLIQWLVYHELRT